jgi:TM2 domain-containing membrane protein YozV
VQYCKSCGSASPFNVNGVLPAVPVAASVPAVTWAMAQAARLPLKSPLGAALLSWLWPGLGHLYAGRAGSGVALLVVAPIVYYLLLLIAAFTLDPLPLIGLLLIALAIAHSAANDARQVNAIRVNARATVRAARGAGYAPSSSPAAPVRPLHTGSMQAAPVIAASQVIHGECAGLNSNGRAAILARTGRCFAFTCTDCA